MRRITYLIVICLLSSNSFALGHFIIAWSGNGTDHMTINIISAKFGGINLEANDEIAVFDGLICCGAIILTKPMTDINTDISIYVSKNEGTGNGYTPGHTISYKFWDSSSSKEISGVFVTYYDTNTGNIISPAPTFSIGESVFVKLTANAPTNQVPVSNAGSDRLLNEGSNVTLDGTASSDADSDPFTYSWSAPAGITLSSTTVAKPTFTAPEVTQDTPYTFSLIVNDGTVNSIADLVVITVKQVNKAPIANAGTDQSVNEAVTVTLNGSLSSDPENNTITYLWTAPTGITLSSNLVVKPTFTAPEVTSDTPYTFSLIVNDGTVNSPADLVVITIKNVDHSPYIKKPIQDLSVDKRAPNQIIDLKTIFADNDIGDLLSYSVTLNTNDQVVKAIITGSDLTLSFSTLNIGTSEIEIMASSNGKEAKSKFKIEVKSPTGIDPLISKQKMIIYPNPTSGKVKVVFDQIPQSGIYLTMSDIAGKTILKQFIENKEELIDLKGNPSGLYFIKTNLNNIIVQKVFLK